MGIVIITAIVILLTILIALTLGLLCRGRNATCMKVVTLLKQKLFWNSVIRYSLQSYLKLAFPNFAALSNLTWDKHSDQARSISALLMSSILFSLPFIYTKVLYNTPALKEAHVEQKIGSLTLGIRNCEYA